MLLPPSLTCRWDKAADIRKHCQILWDILTSAQTTKKSEKKLQTRRGKSILPTLGTIVAMPAYARNPRKMKVMQQIIGVQLWLGGAKREVGNRLNMINLCQGMDVTLATINNLIKDSAKEVYTCKDAVAKNFRRPPSRRRLFTEVDEDGKWIDKDDQSVPLSYSIVFDNVNQKTHAWHQSHTRKNHMLNMVQAYAAKDRIVSLHLSCQDPHPDSILEIPPENYLPDDADVEMLRHEFCSAIGNILHQHTGNLPPNPPEPEKPFHVESSQKSELLPLGILKKMSKAEEMVDTMRDYHQYVLKVPMATRLCYLYGAMALAVSVAMMPMFLYSMLAPTGPTCQGWHLQCKSGISANCTWRIHGRACYSTDSAGTMASSIICAMSWGWPMWRLMLRIVWMKLNTSATPSLMVM